MSPSAPWPTNIQGLRQRTFDTCPTSFTMLSRCQKCPQVQAGTHRRFDGALTGGRIWSELIGGDVQDVPEQLRLLTAADLITILQLPEAKVRWLIDTRQIHPLLLCGEERFDSHEIESLIRTYRQISERKQTHVN